MANCTLKPQEQDGADRAIYVKNILEGQIASDSVDFTNLLVAFAPYGFPSLGDSVMIESSYASSFSLPWLMQKIQNARADVFQNVKKFLNSEDPRAIKLIGDSLVFHDYINAIDNKDDRELFDEINKWIASNRTVTPKTPTPPETNTKRKLRDPSNPNNPSS